MVLAALWSGLQKISGVPAKTIMRIAIEFARVKNKGAFSWTRVGWHRFPQRHVVK
jgi:hypothetical protein